MGTFFTIGLCVLLFFYFFNLCSTRWYRDSPHCHFSYITSVSNETNRSQKSCQWKMNYKLFQIVLWAAFLRTHYPQKRQQEAQHNPQCRGIVRLRTGIAIAPNHTLSWNARSGWMDIYVQSQDLCHYGSIPTDDETFH